VVEAWWFTLVALVVGVLAVGLAAPVSSRRGRATLAVAVVLVVSWAVGADLTMQHPARDGGQYVAIENGDVVRTLTRGEYEAAVMAQTRTIDLAGGLLALALGVLTAQAGIRTADELRARRAS
jgi:hypothetical protein